MYKYKQNGRSSSNKLRNIRITTEYNTVKNARTIPDVNVGMSGNKFETRRTTNDENKEIAREVPSDKIINNRKAFWYYTSR